MFEALSYLQAVDSFFVQLGAYPRPGVEEDAGTQFTCFTSTKVQIDAAVGGQQIRW